MKCLGPVEKVIGVVPSGANLWHPFNSLKQPCHPMYLCRVCDKQCVPNPPAVWVMGTGLTLRVILSLRSGHRATYVPLTPYQSTGLDKQTVSTCIVL